MFADAVILPAPGQSGERGDSSESACLMLVRWAVQVSRYPDEGVAVGALGSVRYGPAR